MAKATKDTVDGPVEQRSVRRSPVKRARAGAAHALNAVKRIAEQALRPVFGIVPYRVSFAGLVLFHASRFYGSTTLVRAFTPVLARGVMRRPDLRVLSPFAERYSGTCETVLFRLGLHPELADFIARRDTATRSLESAGLLARLLFEMEAFEEAFAALSPWFDSRAFRARPDLLQMRGHLDLILGREDDAVRAFALTGMSASWLWAPHQNMAARSPSEYTPHIIDYEAGHLGHLYDAANLVGQRVAHVGAGDRSIRLFARALAVQKTLRASPPRLSPEVGLLLRDFEIEPDELCILPPEWVTQIGHEAMLDILFRMRELGWWQGKAILLAPYERISNRPLLSLLRDLCHVLTLEIDLSPELHDELISLQRYFGMSFNAFELPNGKVVPWQEAGALAIRQWEAEGRRDILRDAYDRVLHLNPAIAQNANAVKRHWGMREDDWFVCLHIRDPGHYGETGLTGQDHRNSGVEEYAAAVEHITKQGGWVIRLGGPAAPRLPRMARVVEYGRSRFKSEMMDLYLIRHCRYFIGTTSGLTNVAVSFGIPSALVNCITTDSQLWSSRVRFILKKVRKHDNRLVSQREFTTAPWRWRMFDAAVLRRHQAIVIDNSAEEILGVVKEVEALADDLRRDVRPDGQEPELIEKWRRSLSFQHFYGNARPSLAYLRANEREFLENAGAEQTTITVRSPDRINSPVV